MSEHPESYKGDNADRAVLVKSKRGTKPDIDRTTTAVFKDGPRVRKELVHQVIRSRNTGEIKHETLQIKTVQLRRDRSDFDEKRSVLLSSEHVDELFVLLAFLLTVRSNAERTDDWSVPISPPAGFGEGLRAVREIIGTMAGPCRAESSPTTADPDALRSFLEQADRDPDLLANLKVRSVLANHEHVIRQIARNELTEEDIVGVAYRKKQLGVFEKLLTDEEYFQDAKAKLKKDKDEAVWQWFFEKNPWVFGYGLSFVFMSNLDSRPLEQVVHGHSVEGGGKRVDGLLKTRAAVSGMCLVEIKKPTDALLEKKAYRPECWPPSRELTEAVCQVQKTVQKATEQIGTCLRPKDDDGYPTGEECFLYQPKGFVIIGRLDEFRRGDDIAQERYASFELYRRNLSNPEVITFDELLERARHIVAHNAAATGGSHAPPAPEE